METAKINNKGQARLFRNNFLEMMSKTHPLIIYSIYFPIIGYMLWYGAARMGIAAGREALIFFAGLVSWTLFEYVMHRYIFHIMAESKVGRRIVYTMHGVHHEYPRDKERLFMPPLPSLVVSGVLFALMYATMGVYALAFFPGFVFGYILYGSMHYAIHSYAPPRLLKALWRNHHLHHYKTPDKGFGVSSVLWDVVFGTVPSKEDASSQETRVSAHH
jgi:sterol desaturase/sphingolipid hydroxylase (fatty acid hydroxylase superfamily)